MAVHTRASSFPSGFSTANDNSVIRLPTAESQSMSTCPTTQTYHTPRISKNAI